MTGKNERIDTGPAAEDCLDTDQVDRRGRPTEPPVSGSLSQSRGAEGSGSTTGTIHAERTSTGPAHGRPGARSGEDAGDLGRGAGAGDQSPREGGADRSPLPALLGYLVLGAYLGVVFVQSEVVSWFRIQEMFRFQSFHMYGIIGTAVAVAGLSVQVIKRLGVKTIHGEPIRIASKEWGGGGIPGARYWIGGTLFGMGWALLGACPGPVFALIGAGISVLVVALASALLGTWAYAALRPRLPH
jgi:uncharacterized protein